MFKTEDAEMVRLKCENLAGAQALTFLHVGLTSPRDTEPTSRRRRVSDRGLGFADSPELG